MGDEKWAQGKQGRDHQKHQDEGEIAQGRGISKAGSLCFLVQNSLFLYLVGKRGVKYFYAGVGKNLLAGEKGLGHENEEIWLRNIEDYLLS